VIEMAATFLRRHRDTIIILLVVVAVTGFNIWQHRNDTPAGYRRYSGNGLSFIYPADCTLREAVVIFRYPSYWLGDLQGESSGGIATVLGVVWGADRASGVPDTMDEILDAASDYYPITDVGIYTDMTLGGKQVSSRKFNALVNDVSVTGLMVGWVSPEGRMFVMYCLGIGRGEDYVIFQLSRMIGSLETEPPPKPR
jgi:hypothetical protein